MKQILCNQLSPSQSIDFNSWLSGSYPSASIVTGSKSPMIVVAVNDVKYLVVNESLMDSVTLLPVRSYYLYQPKSKYNGMETNTET